MDIGEAVREIEVIPEHIPVPIKEPDKHPSPVPTPKEKETVKSVHAPGVMD